MRRLSSQKDEEEDNWFCVFRWDYVKLSIYLRVIDQTHGYNGSHTFTSNHV